MFSENNYPNNLCYNFDNVSFKSKFIIYKMNIKTNLLEEYVDFVDNIKQQQNKYFKIILSLIIIIMFLFLFFFLFNYLK